MKQCNKNTYKQCGLLQKGFTIILLLQRYLPLLGNTGGTHSLEHFEANFNSPEKTLVHIFE